MATPPTSPRVLNSARLITALWGIGLAAAFLNLAAAALKAAVPEPILQKEKTVQEAASHLRSSPPPTGRVLVLLPEIPSESSQYFAYRLQYLAYPIRIDRFYFPWDGMRSEPYSDVYLCDDLTILLPSDVETQSGTVYRLRTPISTGKLHGSSQ